MRWLNMNLLKVTLQLVTPAGDSRDSQQRMSSYIYLGCAPNIYLMKIFRRAAKIENSS